MTPTDWLAVGEGAIGFVLGILVGAVWMLARTIGRCPCHAGRSRRPGGWAPPPDPADVPPGRSPAR